MTQTNEEKAALAAEKDYLKRYKRAMLNVVRLRDKLQAMEDRLGVASPALSDMPRGGGVVKTMGDLVAEREELRERVDRAEAKARAIRKETVAEIERLEDTRHLDVLEAVFLDCMTLEEAAEALGFDVRHTIRLYTAGVTYLAEDSGRPWGKHSHGA